MQAAMAQVVAHLIGSEEVTSSTLVSSFSNWYWYLKRHAKKDILMLNFIVVVEDRPVKLNANEIAEARWCTPEEATQLIRKGTTAEFFLNNAVRELKKKI